MGESELEKWESASARQHLEIETLRAANADLRRRLAIAAGKLAAVAIEAEDHPGGRSVDAVSDEELRTVMRARGLA